MRTQFYMFMNSPTGQTRSIRSLLGLAIVAAEIVPWLAIMIPRIDAGCGFSCYNHNKVIFENLGMIGVVLLGGIDIALPANVVVGAAISLLVAFRIDWYWWYLVWSIYPSRFHPFNPPDCYNIGVIGIVLFALIRGPLFISRSHRTFFVGVTLALIFGALCGIVDSELYDLHF